MKLISLLLLFTVSGLNCYCQEYSIKATIRNQPEHTIYLYQVKGDQFKVLDSTVCNNGILTFKLKEDYLPGVYQLILGQKPGNMYRQSIPVSVNLIFNKENIELITDYNHPSDSLQIITSKENRMYYEFSKKEKEFQIKLELLHPLIVNYPETDPYYKQIVQQYNRLQKNRNAYIDSMATAHSGLFASGIIKMYRSPFLDATVTEEKRVQYYKDHYFDKLDFTDESLLNTSIYSDKIIRYLMFYRNPELTQSEQEDEFIKAVDIILPYTNINDTVYDFVLDYLVRGFEQFNMEKVLNHIADNYLDKKCKTDNTSLLKKRLEAYRKMAIGKTAPEIQIPDINGKEITLSSVKNEYVLVLFWATWCPHCNQLLPDIKEWYNSDDRIDLEVITISLDTVRSEWEEVIREGAYTWINCSDLKGWNGKTEQDYNIYATPTMFLLDRQRKILAKPVAFRELMVEIRNLDGE